jgi:YggT family protein
MRDALTFVFRTLLDLYIITFVLRLILQWVRADFRNPLTQFVLRVTNPLVIPARRLIPPAGNLDTATLVVVLLLELLMTLVMINVACLGSAGIGQIIALTALRVVYLTLRIYLFIILIYVVLSWISPGTHNPAVSLLSSIADPVLRPLRRVIPTIAGLDLSALFAIIGIQAFTMILPIGPAMGGLVCTSVGQLF